MTFDSLNLLQADSILGLMTAFREDPSPDKVDLSVGIYREASGETPVMRAVAKAERAVISDQTTKAYVAPIGIAGFNSSMYELVFGPLADELRARVACIQTPGGCGALRVAGEVFRRASPQAKAYVSDPTWNNHFGLLRGAGLKVEAYPYYDVGAHRLRLDAMLEALSAATPGSLVLLQVSCHNPTGADPDLEAWRAILDLVEERSLLPLFDLAYQGMGVGLDEDVAALRMAAGRLPELMLSVSASKNFGLYRERTGALMILGGSPKSAEVLETQVKDIARGMYSMSASHGALIVERILSEPELRREWLTELDHMRTRIAGLRRDFAKTLAHLRPDLDLDWIASQQGMFSMLGIGSAKVDALREKKHLYMVRDSRINLAGLNEVNLKGAAGAIAPLMR